VSDSSHAELLDQAGLVKTVREEWLVVLKPAPAVKPVAQPAAEKVCESDDTADLMTECSTTESFFIWTVVGFCTALMVYFAVQLTVQLAGIAGYRF